MGFTRIQKKMESRGLKEHKHSYTKNKIKLNLKKVERMKEHKVGSFYNFAYDIETNGSEECWCCGKPAEEGLLCNVCRNELNE